MMNEGPNVGMNIRFVLCMSAQQQLHAIKSYTHKQKYLSEI